MIVAFTSCVSTTFNYHWKSIEHLDRDEMKNLIFNRGCNRHILFRNSQMKSLTCRKRGTLKTHYPLIKVNICSKSEYIFYHSFLQYHAFKLPVLKILCHITNVFILQLLPVYGLTDRIYIHLGYKNLCLSHHD
jgi:hypothetical protein